MHFALVVYDFLCSYENDDIEHLKAVLSEPYQITVDPQATKFCGMSLKWDYDNGHVDISMPGYVEKALHKFTHTKPARAQHAPSKWSVPNYGTAIQYA